MTPIIIPCPQCGRELKIRDRNLLGRKGKCPKCGHAFVMEEPAAVELELAENTYPAEGIGARYIAPNAATPTPALTGTPPVADAPLASLFTPEMRETPIQIKKISARGHWIKFVAAGVAILIVGAVGVYALNNPAPVKTSKTTVNDDTDADGENTAARSTSSGSSFTASPTKGDPIPLEMVPSGAQILIHLRPAALWQAESQGEELRFCLGPLAEYLDQQIKALCKKPPQEIDSVLFALIANTRGTLPSTAVVVRLKDDAKKSELLDLLGGDRVDTYGRPVYVTDQQAGLILDLKTYAIGPASAAQDLVESVGGRAAFSSGIEEIMAKTDRDRHCTIIFEPTAVLLDQEFLVSAPARPLLRECMDWFGDDAEAVAYSFHLDDKRFFSDLVIRNKTSIRPAALEERMVEKIGQLPKELVGLVRQMNPQEVGKRKVVGRFPAMMKAFAMASVGSNGTRYAEVVTALPERAAPNLALGALLAWDESTRTKFSDKPGPSTEDSKPATPIAERLKKKIDVDFVRTPLQDAIAFIADETKVKIDIDGDALKFAGYTKNMPQQFKMDQTTGFAALNAIFTAKGQEKLCLVIDEKKNQAIVMTHQAAEAKGLTPHKFTP